MMTRNEATHHKTAYQVLKEQREVKRVEASEAKKARRKMALEFAGMGLAFIAFAVMFYVGFWELHMIGLK